MTDSSGVAEDADDARFAITQFSFWIANADAKAGLLATATTLLTVALLSQKARVRATFEVQNLPDVFHLALLLLGLLLVFATIIGLFQTLRPRRRTHSFSRYSWVQVAGMSAQEFAASAERATDRDDALMTANALASIVKAKVDALAVAARAWLAGSVLLFAWYMLIP